MQNKMIETPGAKIRENFGKSKRLGRGGMAGVSSSGCIMPPSIRCTKITPRLPDYVCIHTAPSRANVWKIMNVRLK